MIEIYLNGILVKIKLFSFRLTIFLNNNLIRSEQVRMQQ